jgi:pyridoxal phosphate enzyme (YggS family)
MGVVAENIQQVRDRIERAASRSGRNPNEITLVAVSKTVSLPAIQEAIAAGITDLGENYVQEALPKVDALPNVRWHFIGHLQSNKARQVAGRFVLVQSVDSAKLAHELGRRAIASGQIQPVLIEVNLDPASAKTGAHFETVSDLIDAVATTDGLTLQGVMGIPPVGSAEDARPHFARLRQVFEQLPTENRKWLSMGMTNDFEVAIEEGANMVRVGSAIFGHRSSL